jgi:hypothetical protein
MSDAAGGYGLRMDQECEGSGHELPAGPPPDEATACPECGRETKIESHESGGGSTFTIARHQKIVAEGS